MTIGTCGRNSKFFKLKAPDSLASDSRLGVPAAKLEKYGCRREVLEYI
jgi:hypothetical protein